MTSASEHDHLLASECEGQMVELEREYLKEAEYLRVHHPIKPGARDDAPDGCSLSLIAAGNTHAGEIIIL